MLVTVLHDPLRHASGHACQYRLLITDRTGRHPFLSIRPKAATRCCGSTCSGSSAIPRSTSSSCPPLGMVSAILATFTRRPIFGYPAMVLALIAHRLHRLRPVGAPYVRHRPAATRRELLHRRQHDDRHSTSGIQIFCWIATLWTGRLELPRRRCSSCFGFIFIFVIGGLTGVMLASVPLDLQVHDTFFVVAHFHYVLIGGAVFPLFGALPLLVSQVHRPDDDERLGQLAFWLLFVGFNVTFFPMHIARPAGHAAPHLHLSGRDGLGPAQPARRRSAPHHGASASCCFSSTSCAACAAASRPAPTPGLPARSNGPRPRRQSPGNFARPPVVTCAFRFGASRHRRRGAGLADHAAKCWSRACSMPKPDHRAVMPESSIWPFVVGAGGHRAVRRLDLHAVGYGVGYRAGHAAAGDLVLAEACADAAQHRARGETMKAQDMRRVARLPTYVYGSGSMMWWGTMGLMLIEGTVFAITLVVYFYLRSHSPTWPIKRHPSCSGAA